MRHASCVALSAALLTTTCLHPVFAQEKAGNSQKLDTVTVYATKSANSSFDVPAIVNVIDTEAPGNALSSSTKDLLNHVPGVEVDNGPRRNGQTVSIRGFDAEAIITLKDGRRQNFEAAHDGRFFIDPSLLKRVEVVKGAASSIYGGGAVGGVVAFETKDAADLLNPGQTAGASLTVGGRSGNEEFSTIMSGYGRTEYVDLIGSISFRKSGDIQTGGGGELDTDDSVLSGLFKAGVTVADWHTLKFEFQGSNNDGQEPNNGAGAIGSSNPIVDKTVRDLQYSLKYAFEDPGNNWLNTKLHAYFNDTEVEETDITGTNAGRVQSRAIETLGFTAENQSKWLVSNTHAHTFTYGLEIYQDDQEGKSTATGDGSRPGVPDAETLNYGFFLQDEITVNTGVGRFLIIPGVRYDRFQSEDNDGNEQDESSVSPKIALSYNPTDNFVIFGSVAQAFRAPNMTEVYAAGLHFPGAPPFVPDNNFVPNPDLEPEKVLTYELGAGVDLDKLFTADDALNVKGSIFLSKGKDFITQEVNVGAGTTQFLNIDNAELYGFELSSKYRIGAFEANAGLSYVHAEDEDTGEYISNNVPLTLTTDLNYTVASYDSVIGFRSRFAKANDRVNPGDDPTGGYGVHDIYYRWAPADGNFENLTVDFGISNIFDKEYSKRYAVLDEEGRSFNLRASYKW
ncbi:TonB-dependent hemoglobin/transferrin/lactoferrin family receptor [Sneathiella sp. P13V-1]|uniref:TonB-dependent hemoglobin/transferrin/lactoferrin family receptor n=1 Tax=Sneathiella sp. P13V-1 TaxID=2697366 RepID=UPI00187B56E5|nr:TonB-dependent hemoglobin/transferrin/lactoferrin family receptor [Sneathiella sp. P13V-1]MBE7636607.1 TonB-dependent hemoglobin/transferrin/lactoferrin family receptor [Sneathiella sp. P13V-1]